MLVGDLKAGALIDLDPVIDEYGAIGCNDVASLFEYATVLEDAQPCDDTPGGVWLVTDLGTYVVPSTFDVPVESTTGTITQRPTMGQKAGSS